MQKKISSFSLHGLQDAAVDAIAEIGPWISPIPTAVLVGKATAKHLGWDSFTAGISGVIVEVIGISTVDTAVKYYNYNQTRRKSEPIMPTWLPVVLTVVYLSSTVILTVLLDTVTDLVAWAPLVFPLLSLTGALNLVLRRHLRNQIAKNIELRKPSASQALDAPQAAQAPAQVAPQAPQAPEYICTVCDPPRVMKNQQALAAHSRKHKRLDSLI